MSEIEVVVAYALPQQQYLLNVRLPSGSSVEDAIIASGILQQCPQIDLQNSKVGIYSRQVMLRQIVQQGDRVEIYRPLLADPKVLRRQRADQQRQKG